MPALPLRGLASQEHRIGFSDIRGVAGALNERGLENVGLRGPAAGSRILRRGRSLLLATMQRRCQYSRRANLYSDSFSVCDLMRRFELGVVVRDKVLFVAIVGLADAVRR